MSGSARIFGFLPSRLDAACVARLVAGRRRDAASGVGLVITANIDHVARLRQDTAFAAAYAAAAIVTCDGFPVLRYARLRGCAVPGRVTGCDIFAELLRRLAEGTQHALFFVADSNETAAGVERWAARHGLAARTRIAVAPPRFADRPATQRALAAAIRGHDTSVLILGIGAPRSEVFVHRHRHLLPPCWALCVGQALRVEMGLVPRAPALWQRLNLEWAWRLRLEPRRLAARYTAATAGFLLAVARDLARGTIAPLLAAALTGLAGCSAPPPLAPAAPVAAAPPYLLHAGDEVEVLFTDTPELNLRQAIRSDGDIAMPITGDVPAAGLTVPQLHDALAQRYAHQLVRPNLTVVLRTAVGNRVFVGGEVVQQGAEPLEAPLTASRAIIMAQGLKPTADVHQVLVIRAGADGRPAAHSIDLGQVLAGAPDAVDPVLQPFDIVFVPNAPIAQLDRFVDQYIRQLLPTTPSVLYQINPTGTTVHP